MRGWMGAVVGACVILAGTWSLPAQSGGQARAREPVIGGPCEGCEAVFQGLPDALATHARIAPPGEPGEPMRIAGSVIDRQGRPASGVIVYAYHTNARGVYPPEDRFTGLAAYRHGRLRGWAITDEHGGYAFDTIRPASYPDRSLPAHVHMHVIEVGRCTYYIDSIHFDDDPLLTSAETAGTDGRGGSGIVHPSKDAVGVWTIRRDIRLGEGVPGYQRGCGTTLEPDTGYYQDLSWGPDGQHLVISVLQSTRDGGFQYRVKRIDLSGMDYTAISEGPMDYWTSWSPDGSRVAFSSERNDNTDIYSVTPEGTDRTRLTDHSATDTQPAWSPDGSRIAFVSDRDGERRIYIMATGGAPGLLSPEIHHAETPAWSPDGSRIAYFQTDAAGNDSIAVVSLEGLDRTVLAAGVWPSWSADGSRVLFGRDGGLHEMDANGGTSVRITNDGAFGRYSPDGSHIAVIGTDGGDVIVSILRTGGSARRVLLRRPAPRW